MLAGLLCSKFHVFKILPINHLNSIFCKMAKRKLHRFKILRFNFAQNGYHAERSMLDGEEETDP